MTDFVFERLFQLAEDTTPYTLLTKDYVRTENFMGKEILVVEEKGIEMLCEKAFTEIAHLLRPGHLAQLKRILEDPEASQNDRYVAMEFLKNADISSEFEFPMCQDTGTAIVVGFKGQQVYTGFSDEKALCKGVYNAYRKANLRYSQDAALTMYEEINTNTNLPAQVDILATENDQYEFLFIAKGGGSANKTYFYQETAALLHPKELTEFLTQKMKTLGTAACPPYHLAVVVGGTSAEANLKTVKLASAKFLDGLPTAGDSWGRAFRDTEMEETLYRISREIGIGAQFGGKAFAHDVRVVRLPRHGASLPISIGVSCSADRNMKAKITKQGIYFEELERNPSRFIPENIEIPNNAVLIDLNHPMKEILAELTKYPIKTRLSLSGKIVVARDLAHSRLKERLDRGEELPDYFREYPVYYAGPAKTPEGYPCGSFGPTTAGRMDSYVEEFQRHGGSMIMLAKGNRSKVVTESCKKYGGFYLGSIGGPAARLGKECITSEEIIEYPELGMEAIYMITVKDFPAFILVDDKGNDFFAELID